MLSSPADWLPGFDRTLLRRLISPRALRIALASAHRYVALPTMSGDGAVRAALSDAGPEAAVSVELRMDEDKAITGRCSRCLSAFGPCAHVAILAADLAISVPLRDALLEGTSAEEAAARAPALRLGVHLELNFDGALDAWLAPALEGAKVEIAASPFAELAPTLGKTYGDRIDPGETRIVSMVVRRHGERKLLTPREISGSVTFSSRDRRVLGYVRDRGAGRKATYAVGVEASLAIEAMRLHAGIFVEGFKGLLDFRTTLVRPAIALAPAGSQSAPFDALSAFWIGEADRMRISFADSFFFSGPFPYVWTKSGAIYPVASDVDLDFVSQLARSPELLVPPGKLKAAGARLLGTARRRGITLPSHEAFGLPAPITPRLLLRLMGEPLNMEGELVAIYGAREFPLYPASKGSTDRDGDEEASARSAIERAGLRERVGDPDDDIDESPPRVVVSGDAAIEFWQTGLLALREETAPKIEVELSRRLAHVRIGTPVTGRVHVALEGDWLETRLEFGAKDLPVELSAIRDALARKQRWVVLSDGTLTRISASIEALANEANDVLKGQASGRLPAHQLGRLDRWIEENDGRIDAKVDAFRKRLRALAVSADPDMPRGLRGELRPYQKLGLAWLQFLQTLGAGGILADDMGLGKTITTLAFLLRRKELEGPMPSLVVCPTSVATNWVSEIKRFTPDLKVILLHGPARHAQAVKESDVVITTYALLRRDLDVLSAIRFRCAVLDEAQNIKNADSATTRAAGQLDASMRLALSGTPIENRLGELWSLASFVNPGILGTARAFETRFERPIVADRKSPLAAELRAVVRPFLLRRTKDEVLRELPPKTEIDRVVPLSVRDKRMYDALAHTLRAGIAKDLESRGNQAQLSVFTALARLRQMACDPRLVDPHLPPEVSAKRKEFLELVRELAAEGRRALVFSQFVELLTLWRQDLDAENIAYEYLDGRTTKRSEVVARFQGGSAPLFLISLKAGGVGLNLTAADTVIHCDPWWNPAVEDQATDRAYRIGQDKPVTVVRLVARGTIEEKILVLKKKKRELTKVVIGDDARALEGLTNEDLSALLGDADLDPMEEHGSDEDSALRRGSPTDKLATARRVLSPDYQLLVTEVQRWLATSGRLESELASMVDMPLTYASRLARGEPFPCSRAVADRIRAHLRSW